MPQLRPLSERDRALLDLLKDDGRITWTEAAHRLGISRIAVQKRVDALVAAGWIKGFSVRLGAQVDPKSEVEAFLRIKFLRGMDCFKLFGQFGSDEIVKSVWGVTGEWDAILHLRAKRFEDISEFREMLVAAGGINKIETEAILNILR